MLSDDFSNLILVLISMLISKKYSVSFLFCFIFLLSCNRNDPPLPCLSVEEELENLQNVKEKITINYEIDSNGVSTFDKQEKRTYDKDGILIGIESRQDSTKNFDTILTLKNTESRAEQRIIEYFDFKNDKKLIETVKINQYGKFEDKVVSEIKKVIFTEKYLYDSNLRDSMRILSYGNNYKAIVEKKYSKDGIIESIKISNKKGKHYQYKYYPKESGQNIKCYKYIDNNNKILKTEFLEFDSNNNPTSKRTYINDSLVWLRIIEYEYY